uniref:Helix-hairpin-helix DNA-binding motif class 1 domain-containing protein n=1 Tax=uncultured Armatimonadetes bacterium TaxID=157466 RepID=A0A6J4I518_9BACT|nr:hypothetical protein AVDCRST_MAG63-2506 [uncultured Armatimonadetes bacterium]
MKDEDEAYADAKGRTRWPGNEDLADKLKALGDYLIIGGYDESHAARYNQLAYRISRHPEPVRELHRDKRLREIDGVGDTIADIIGELIESGTCAKWKNWAENTPETVLEMRTIPGLGVKTIRALYREHGIDCLAALREALADGRLDGVKGLGPKTREAIRAAPRSQGAPPPDA